jgi:hypothetical protein
MYDPDVDRVKFIATTHATAGQSFAGEHQRVFGRLYVKSGSPANLYVELETYTQADVSATGGFFSTGTCEAATSNTTGALGGGITGTSLAAFSNSSTPDVKTAPGGYLVFGFLLNTDWLNIENYAGSSSAATGFNGQAGAKGETTTWWSNP